MLSRTSMLDVPPSVALRPARPDDAEFLFSVYASTRAEELAQVDWDDAQKEDFLRRQFEAQRQCYEGENYPGAEFHVVLVGGAPVGRLYVHRRETGIRIMDLAMLPEFRGHGVGTGLLRGLLDEGERSGQRVSIHVEAFNPALRLYERLGFQMVSTDGVYLLMERQPEVACPKEAPGPRSETV